MRARNLFLLAILGPAALATPLETNGYLCLRDGESGRKELYGSFELLGEVTLEFADDAVKQKATELASKQCGVFGGYANVKGKVKSEPGKRRTVAVERVGTPEAPPPHGTSVYLVSRIARYKFGEELTPRADLFKEIVEKDGMAKVDFVNVTDSSTGLVAVIPTLLSKADLESRLKQVQDRVNHEKEAFHVQALDWSDRQGAKFVPNP